MTVSGLHPFLPPPRGCCRYCEQSTDYRILDLRTDTRGRKESSAMKSSQKSEDGAEKESSGSSRRGSVLNDLSVPTNKRQRVSGAGKEDGIVQVHDDTSDSGSVDVEVDAPPALENDDDDKPPRESKESNPIESKVGEQEGGENITLTPCCDPV